MNKQLVCNAQIVIFILASIFADTADADDTAKFNLVPSFDISLTQKKEVVNASLAFKKDAATDTGLWWTLKARLPLNGEVEGNKLTSLDEVSDWKLGISFDHGYENPVENSPTRQRWRVGVDFEWGYKEFTYYEGGGTDKSKESKHSYVTGFRLIHNSFVKEPRSMFAPQLLIKYSKEWKEPDKVGVVIPGEDGNPDTVKNKVIIAPKLSPALYIRPALYMSLLKKWAWGVSAAYTYSNEIDDNDPFGDDERLRLELWLYHHPAGKDSINTRIGAGLFWDRQLEGLEEDDEELLVGIQFQIKYGIVGYEY